MYIYILIYHIDATFYSNLYIDIDIDILYIIIYSN